MSEQYLTFEQIQQRELAMMKYVDEICRREGLTYWMCGGTLLGAVRHQGFIPWDDDVDLMMPRPDYERLLALAPKYSNERFALKHCRFDDQVSNSWLRVLDLNTQVESSHMVKYGLECLFLDVFPVDALPANPLLSRLRFARVRVNDILMKCARRQGFYPGERLRILKRLIKALTRGHEPNYYARKTDSFCSRKPLEGARFAGVQVICHYNNRERMPIAAVQGTVMLPFCDGDYPAPVGWETYLRNIYGDYMKLPPEEKRRPPHNTRARIIEP